MSTPEYGVSVTLRNVYDKLTQVHDTVQRTVFQLEALSKIQEDHEKRIRLIERLAWGGTLLATLAGLVYTIINGGVAP